MWRDFRFRSKLYVQYYKVTHTLSLPNVFCSNLVTSQLVLLILPTTGMTNDPAYNWNIVHTNSINKYNHCMNLLSCWLIEYLSTVILKKEKLVFVANEYFYLQKLVALDSYLWSYKSLSEIFPSNAVIGAIIFDTVVTTSLEYLNSSLFKPGFQKLQGKC